MLRNLYNIKVSKFNYVNKKTIGVLYLSFYSLKDSGDFCISTVENRRLEIVGSLEENCSALSPY